MVVHRAFRYRLDVSPQQQVLLRQFVGVIRLVYNLALEQRRDWWRQYRRAIGSNLNYVAQARELTALRAEPDDDDRLLDDFTFRRPEPFVILIGLGLTVLTIAGAVIAHSLFKAGAWR